MTRATDRGRSTTGTTGGGRWLLLLGPLVEEGLAQLAAEWRRHALTLVGTAWGATTVVLLLSIGSGFSQFLDLRIDKTGRNWTLLRGMYTQSEAGGYRPGERVTFESEDLARVRAGVALAAEVGAEIEDLRVAETPLRTRPTVVAAITPEIQRIQNHALAEGRPISDADDSRSRHVALIGAEVAKSLFGTQSPVGREVQVDGTPFEVIGLLAPKGMQLIRFKDDHDNMIFIPLRTAQNLFDRRGTFDHLFLDPYVPADSAAMAEQARAVLWPRHRIASGDRDAVLFEDVPGMMAPTRIVALALQLLLGGVGTLILLISGVGVANLMVALVSARGTELAMRRACGARRGDILVQILVETLIVVTVSGAVGVAFALLAVGVVAALPLPPSFPKPHASVATVVTTFAVLFVMGLAAGVLPARLAARVDPSSAMRAL